ncbi:MAG: GNAT family N-acetyltransferase [Myxococcota bacterium]
MPIRVARAGDRDGIVALWGDLIEHHRRLDPQFPVLPTLREVLGREIERGFRSARCRLGVAEQNGTLVGFVFAEIEVARGRPGRDSGHGWVHEIYVDPTWRGRGLAAGLLELADAFFEARGVTSVSVRVEAANRDARSFWASRAFRESARILTRG